MLKKNRKSPKQKNKILLTLDKEKVPTICRHLFYCYYMSYIQQNIITLHTEAIVVDGPGKVACFDLEIEPAELHRNKEKTPLRNLTPNQQLRRVVSFFLIWW